MKLTAGLMVDTTYGVPVVDQGGHDRKSQRYDVAGATKRGAVILTNADPG
jgi:hypothetical protein